MTTVSYGAALFLYLKIGTVTLEIIFMEHRMLQTKTNRKQLKEDYYAVGAFKKGTPGDMDYEEDLLSFLGVESVGEVLFLSRLQIRGAIIHSRSYKRVSRRNNYTVVYQEGNSTFYGQIEVFFVAKDVPRMCCGAVVSRMSVSNQCLCEKHDFFGSTVTHIVCLHQPNRVRFSIVPLEDIIDVCIYMKFSDCDFGYAALFANHIERD
ncbi:uncharacterized protein [Montipora capricornis]|uniref:uncharacterized protein n=1 Tax=Montipora capricornis TaxID=246305 RepID=UPI0035F16FD8